MIVVVAHVVGLAVRASAHASVPPDAGGLLVDVREKSRRPACHSHAAPTVIMDVVALAGAAADACQAAAMIVVVAHVVGLAVRASAHASVPPDAGGLLVDVREKSRRPACHSHAAPTVIMDIV